MKTSFSGKISLKKIAVIALFAVTVLCAVLLCACKAKLVKITADCSISEAAVGDSLDKKSVTVIAYYGDNRSKVVSDFSLNYDFSSKGAKTVAVSYSENGITKTASFTVTVKEPQPPTPVLQSISATCDVSKVTVGDTLDKNAVTVTAKYDTSSDKAVGDFTLSYDFSTSGSKQVTVTYSENGVTKTASFTVTVEAPQDPEPALYAITAKYNGGEVEIGATLDKKDIVVTATYNDGENNEIEGYSKVVTDYLLEYDFSEAGNKQVVVSYSELGHTKTTVFYVTVKPSQPDVALLTSITAVYDGGQIEVGGVLNNADITVTATYGDGSFNTVTNFNVGGFSSATAGSKTVTVTYSENGVTVSCSFTVTVIEPTVVSNSNVSVHFMELGNNQTGDSVYIKAGETDILIDAGSNKSSTPTLIKYLDNFVMDGKLEYVIATHAHEDHIAGFVGQSGGKGIFEYYQCETIIDFNLTNYGMTDSSGKPTLYAEYVEKRTTAEANGAMHYTALDCYNNSNGAKRIYNLTPDGDVQLEILYQKYYEETYKSSENNYSVCCLIRQGNNNYLFTGDLESGGETSLAEKNKLPEVTLYKAGHHGSNTSSSAKLLNVIKPQYVVVCCCAGNVQYTQNLANTFPYQETINRIAPYTDNVYVTTMGIIELDNPSLEWDSSTNRWRNKGFTSMNGNVVFTCNNGEITVRGSNNNLKLKDTEWFKKYRDCPAVWE